MALFIALGGSAYAVTRLPANSVGTAQLRKGAVTLTKVAASARASLRGATGATGPAGPRGATGATGAAGLSNGSAGGSLSGTYPSPTIAHGVITSAMLGPGAVTSTALGSGVVTSAALGSGAVTSAALGSGAVTSAALGSGAVLPANMGTVPAASLLIGNNFSNSVPNNTFQLLAWDGTVSVNDDNTWNNQANVLVLQAPIAGLYQIGGGVEWSDSSHTGGYRFVGISVNGGCCDAASNSAAAPGLDTMQNVGELLHLNAGDSVTLDVEQTSGSTLSIANTGASYIDMHWVGP